MTEVRRRKSKSSPTKDYSLPSCGLKIKTRTGSCSAFLAIIAAPCSDDLYRAGSSKELYWSDGENSTVISERPNCCHAKKKACTCSYCCPDDICSCWPLSPALVDRPLSRSPLLMQIATSHATIHHLPPRRQRHISRDI